MAKKIEDEWRTVVEEGNKQEKQELKASEGGSCRFVWLLLFSDHFPLYFRCGRALQKA